MTFASTIYDLRRELRLTQAELAALLRVDKQSVSNWECGRNAPWPERQMEILLKMGHKPDSAGLYASRRPSISERILRDD